MKADEKRIMELDKNPDSDEILEGDIALVRAGLLYLPSCHNDKKRVSMWVEPHPDALNYMRKHGRLSPAHRTVLRSTVAGTIRQSDIEYARTCITNH